MYSLAIGLFVDTFYQTLTGNNHKTTDKRLALRININIQSSKGEAFYLHALHAASCFQCVHQRNETGCNNFFILQTLYFLLLICNCRIYIFTAILLCFVNTNLHNYTFFHQQSWLLVYMLKMYLAYRIV